MTRPPTLPRALRANALASLVTGLAGVLMSAPLAETIGLIHGTTYQVLGGALIVHMLMLMWAAGRATIAWWTRVNLVGLAAYVVALLGVLALGATATVTGSVLLAADALLVTLLAGWQFRALNASAPQPVR
ncbi:hypothetical protein [Gymnodinialimonas hymeniacidonis]|uniref:hypothetical protein n=1 Tax=Gymnodinialimonas hymeniacidonis TaxID=3126508 RepID=UPI0034C5FF1A